MRQNAKSTYLQSPHTFAEKVRHTTGCEDVVIINQIEKKKDRKDSILNDNKQAVLDFNWEPYLNINLFKEEQEEIVQTLNLRNECNRPIKMQTILQMLEENGYTVNKERAINPNTGTRARCVIITK